MLDCDRHLFFQAQSTQVAGHDTRANLNANPLMLLECSVDTPIHINRSHLLASCGVSRPASCVDWALDLESSPRASLQDYYIFPGGGDTRNCRKVREGHPNND